MRPTYFKSVGTFRDWLAKNYDKSEELLVGFQKKSSGVASVTYREALDEAVAYGWIDGVRRSVNATSYTIRFTPRKPRSNLEPRQHQASP